MEQAPEKLTAVVEGRFGQERQITLVRQPDGQYKEVAEVPETLTATVEGRFGEERQITLVRQPDGQYREPADTGQPVAL